MFNHNLFYFIHSDEELTKMKSNIKISEKTLDKLKSSFFKTAAKKERIAFMEKNIAGAKKACKEYEERQLQFLKIKKATIFETNFKVSGTTYRLKEVNQAIRYIDQNEGIDKYEGLTNKEIREYGYDRVYKYAHFDTKNFSLESEPENEYDKNAIKVLVNGIHIGYVPKENAKVLIEFIKKPKNTTGGTLKIIGGIFKEFNYLEDKIITRKDNFGFEVDLKLYDSTML